MRRQSLRLSATSASAAAAGMLAQLPLWRLLQRGPQQPVWCVRTPCCHNCCGDRALYRLPVCKARDGAPIFQHLEHGLHQVFLAPLHVTERTSHWLHFNNICTYLILAGRQEQRQYAGRPLIGRDCRLVVPMTVRLQRVRLHSQPHVSKLYNADLSSATM